MPGRGPRSVRSFHIEESSLENGTRIVEVHGELDLATAGTLGQRIRRPLFWEGTRCVVVDLSEVAFIDSSGASALLLSAGHARALGLALVFVCPEGAPMRRLRLYGLDSRLRIFATRQLALDALESQPGAS